MPNKYSKRIVSCIRKAPWLLTRASDLAGEHRALQGNNFKYKKYIVLAHQRSGSSMVIAALRKHPQTVAFGELFVLNRIGFNLEGYDNHSGKLLALRDRYPDIFLDNYIYSGYKEGIRAVGFKLFPEQADRIIKPSLWNWLTLNNDVRIILLSRHNMLATYSSLLMARKTGQYGISNETERTRTTLNIDYDECLTEFKKYKQYHEKTLERIKGHDVLNVTYETMVSDISGTLRGFQEFLELDIHSLPIDKVKQEVRPLSDVIENYSELRERFSRTEWAYLFAQ